MTSNATISALEPCPDLVSDELIRQYHVILSFIVLGLINVVVICGNTLVIAAVAVTSKLQTITNYFIVSLAVADLLVGLTTLPFSLTYEVLKIWVFGTIWCQVWLAVDVWLSTSSILNLCAISFDRYIAVTRPVQYPSLMTSKRARILIAAVWIVSFVICFPPLVGWNDANDRSLMESVNSGGGGGGYTKKYVVSNRTDNPNTINSSHLSHTYNNSINRECPSPNCSLINDSGYRIYSALGSFYLPMMIMLFFYWRIYKAAVATTKAINQGFLITKQTNRKGRMDEQRLTLRIHRGRPSYNTNKTEKGEKAKRGASFGEENDVKEYKHSSYRSSNDSTRQLLKSPRNESGQQQHLSSMASREDTEKNNSGPRLYSQLSAKSSSSSEGREANLECGKLGGVMVSKRSLKFQARRFRTETKAAKTVGVILGAFFFCWFPFFTIYLIGGFCTKCIPDWLFSVFFWLGYCNSGINPCIYALFSRDFRHAFKRILCRCSFSDEPPKNFRVEGALSSMLKSMNLGSVGEDCEDDKNTSQ